MKNNAIRIGYIGVGHMGQYHVNVSCNIPDYKPCGIYDISMDRANEISKQFHIPVFQNVDSLLSEVDALVLAVPTVHHYALARQALEKGKHVLVEKPMTETVEQAQELVHLAETQGLIFQVGHVERFNGAVAELGKIVDKPYLIESKRLAPRSDRVQDIGVVLDLMIHDIDIVLNLVQDEVHSVHACGQSCIPPHHHEDFATAIIQFRNGCVANLIASRAAQSKTRELHISQPNALIVLDFSTQNISVHRLAASAYLMTQKELKYKQDSFVEKIAVHRDNPLKQEHDHFIGCIRGVQKPLVDGYEELRTLEIANNILSQLQSQAKTLVV